MYFGAAVDCRESETTDQGGLLNNGSSEYYRLNSFRLQLRFYDVN